MTVSVVFDIFCLFKCCHIVYHVVIGNSVNVVRCANGISCLPARRVIKSAFVITKGRAEALPMFLDRIALLWKSIVDIPHYWQIKCPKRCYLRNNMF